MNVELLSEIRLTSPQRVVFANGDALNYRPAIIGRRL